MENKICTRCLLEQNIENFYVRRTRNNQRKTVCKNCESQQKAKKIILVEDLEDEIWKDIEGYEGIYQVSNLSRVKRIMGRKNPDSKLMKSTDIPDSYTNICLTHLGKQKTFLLHRLVAIAHIPNPENKPEVNHIGLYPDGRQGNKHDNRAISLEWATISENRKHAVKEGLYDTKGEKHNQSKLIEKEVLAIRKIGRTMTLKEIGFLYNISEGHVSDILLRKAWNHI